MDEQVRDMKVASTVNLDAYIVHVDHGGILSSLGVFEDEPLWDELMNEIMQQREAIVHAVDANLKIEDWSQP